MRPILWAATILHIAWGVALILIPTKVAHTTGLHFFSTYPRAWGLVMLLSANIAFAALVHEWKGRPVNGWTFWAFIPQQSLLIVSAVAVVWFSLEGRFADGTVVPGGGWFVLIDQLPKILLAILHPVGLLRMHLPIFPEARVGGHVG